MNFHIIIFVVVFICLIIFKLTTKKLFLYFSIFLSVGVIFIPNKFLGKWNLIKRFDNTKIIKVILSPSDSIYPKNLIDTALVIMDKERVVNLSKFFKTAYVIFPSHPSIIWETYMTFYSDGDSLQFIVRKTKNMGTLIYTPSGGKYTADSLSAYLEKIGKFVGPVKIRY